MTPARSLLIAMVAVALLIGARPIAGVEQYPHGLMSATPTARGNNRSCTIETRPISFGDYDTLAERDVDAIGQVIYTCSVAVAAVVVAVTPVAVTRVGRGQQRQPG